jgi:hypothetical protein
MPNANTYVRGEWTVGGSGFEIGSLEAPIQSAYAGVPVLDAGFSLAVTSSAQLWGATAPDPTDWDICYIQSDTVDITVVLRSGGSDANTSAIVVKAGTRVPLFSNKTTAYSATLATRLSNAQTAIDQIWIYNPSGTVVATGRIVLLT